MHFERFNNKTKDQAMQPIAAFSFLFAKPRPVPERRPSRLARIVRRSARD